MEFDLKADFEPAGDQPDAIAKLIKGLKKGRSKQTLLGVTGSGKTFTMANVVKEIKKPTIVIAHNKTLAFQLYTELKEFFPNNAVEYFISYYDYYQPESYLPSSDTYIEKDAKINPKIEQMRLAATTSLMTRKDVIIVASVSCIYGLGNPQYYQKIAFRIKQGMNISRRDLMLKLLDMQYERNDTELVPGRFRVKGGTIDVVPSYQDNPIRITMQGDMVAGMKELEKTNFAAVKDHEEIMLFPAKHFVVEKSVIDNAVAEIREELHAHLPEMETTNKLFAHRLNQKVNYDLEMIEEMGYCSGIENYSRFFDGRKEGEKPYCLFDYFLDDYLLIVDESHQTLPQLRAMYKGDRSRKETLIEYGFRLPSALDNRPLQFEEFQHYMKNVIFVSATPGDFEVDSSEHIVEQIIRPTGLVDPEIEIRPAEGQIQDLIKEINENNKRGFRTLITTLTKRLAEELTDFLGQQDIKVRYLHSEIDSLERTEIIRQLRLGKFDVLVGINLLREGLDIPEVGLVGILDADKEGFLRNDRSLIQTIGRAARNAESKVILYADKTTEAMTKTVTETNRRRSLQLKHNEENNITPKTIIKPVADKVTDVTDVKSLPKSQIPNLIIELESNMRAAAESLDFEEAIMLRDKINSLKSQYKPS